MDIRIESFGHWGSVNWIRDVDSGLVKIGMVIGDTRARFLPCDGLHQQEA